ncbi:MAG TPA: beta-N-acetylglucosaminidase domain-containing protein [Acidobacteriota bacterium]|nr:beta-N-acetylglucosaminidase domain-containing protein [Acidobacteriota bacterium]
MPRILRTARVPGIVIKAGWAAALALSIVLAFASGCGRSGPDPLAPAFRVTVPAERAPFPTPLPSGRKEPGFVLRGTKGWAWTWDQYLAEIPYLARYKMNFLMSCYTSVFTDPVKFVNRWWEPLPQATLAGIGKVAAACRDAGITYCFSFHPALFSDRPLRYDSDEDFDEMWRNYASVQALGVRWFSLSYDDIDVKGRDIAALGAAHAGLANRLFGRLREKDPEAELIFCPVYYWGPADQGEARLYTESLGRALDKDIFVFWTGDGIVTPRITRGAAESFRKAVDHRLVIWDNYPVNDRSGALHLGPVVGRDPDLDEVAYGYMSNPLAPQNEINRIPLLTCADYAYNPRAYDPARSIGQAIRELAETPSRIAALKDLVELYPGNLISGSALTGYNCVLEKVASLVKEPGGRKLARRLISRVEGVAARLDREFPDGYAETKKTLAAHIAAARDMLSAPGPAPSIERRAP